MADWYVSVLLAIRDMAAESGMLALAEEIDGAILVAANESHGNETRDLGTVDVRSVEHDPRAAVGPAGAGGVRRYH